MHRKFLGLLVCAAATAALAAVVTSSAQSAAEFESSISNNYPVNLEFNLTASSESEITDVSLHYSIVGRGTLALGKPDEVTAGNLVFVTVEIPTNAQSSYIPVGSEFLYFWELTLVDGSTVTGDEESFFFLPAGPELEDGQQ